MLIVQTPVKPAFFMGANKRESDLNYQMITTNDELASLCEVTRDFPAIAPIPSLSVPGRTIRSWG